LPNQQESLSANDARWGGASEKWLSSRKMRDLIQNQNPAASCGQPAVKKASRVHVFAH
jgi:hypothetical protein